MREIHLTLSAIDDHPLAATLFEPPRPPLAAVQINSATGVPRRYYRAYARFLAERGFAVICYDYRGIGDSRFMPSRRPHLSMRAWGERDYAAVLDHLHARYPRLPLLAVGHSVGGQLLGLAPNNHKLSAALGIASQAGYWGHWPRHLQPAMLAIWYLAVPMATRLTDPTPARLLGAELPRDIAREWARWCRHPDFIVDARGRALRAGFERYRGRMRLIAIADDAFYAPPDAVAALARMYTHADVELDTISPADAGVESIGHFGFFRSAMPRRLWQSSADWLVESLPGNRREAA